MIDVLFVDEQVILAATAQMPSVMAVLNLATLHRTAPTRFLPWEHRTTKTYLVQGINIPTPKGPDPTPPTMVPDMGYILAGHSPTVIPTTIEAAVSEGTLLIPHLAATAACATLWLIDAPITTHTITLTIIVKPHSTLTTSPSDNTHATPQTRPGLTPAAPTTLHRTHSQEKPSYI